MGETTTTTLLCIFYKMPLKDIAKGGMHLLNLSSIAVTNLSQVGILREVMESQKKAGAETLKE